MLCGSSPNVEFVLTNTSLNAAVLGTSMRYVLTTCLRMQNGEKILDATQVVYDRIQRHHIWMMLQQLEVKIFIIIAILICRNYIQ